MSLNASRSVLVWSVVTENDEKSILQERLEFFLRHHIGSVHPFSWLVPTSQRQGVWLTDNYIVAMVPTLWIRVTMPHYLLHLVAFCSCNFGYYIALISSIVYFIYLKTPVNVTTVNIMLFETLSKVATWSGKFSSRNTVRVFVKRRQ
jgi:hypothetical protein